MRRREFIGLLGGAAAWPAVARAPDPDRTRRIGVLVGLADDDAGMKPRLAALKEELDRLRWIEGRTVMIDFRHAPGGAGRRTWRGS